jgi:hypothetical protein
MAQKQMAVVVVPKHWFNSGAHLLLNNGEESGSDGETHFVIAPVDDVSDAYGLWLKDITTTGLTKNGSPVEMRFMIPWQFVLGLGLMDDQTDKAAFGFRHGSATVLDDAAGG